MNHDRLTLTERSRIARELHDEVGQTLTGVMLQVEGLAGVIPDDLRAQLDELRETARHATKEVSRIARRLRPEMLEELGLQRALAALTTAVGNDTGIVVRRHLEPAPGLTAEQELVIFRVAQEALTDVARQAAETAELVLTHSDRRTVLTVADDGRGPAPSANDMRERAMLIGAELTISRREGGGTKVQLVVPPSR